MFTDAFFSQNGVVDSSTGFGNVNKSTGQNNTVLNTEIEQIIQNSETPKWINRRGRVTSSVARFRKEKQRVNFNASAHSFNNHWG